ncbi:hypothetical protein [Pseudooceanicola sp. MF1-13]
MSARGRTVNKRQLTDIGTSSVRTIIIFVEDGAAHVLKVRTMQ